MLKPIKVYLGCLLFVQSIMISYPHDMLIVIVSLFVNSHRVVSMAIDNLRDDTTGKYHDAISTCCCRWSYVTIDVTY